MSYIAMITVCTQPLGQILYGLLFDTAPIRLILIPTGLTIMGIGIIARGFFKKTG